MSYDYEKYTFRPNWSNGLLDTGALRIAGHGHICAMLSTNQAFTKEAYRGRLDRRELGTVSAWGQPSKPLPKITVEQLMHLDMDYILSAIHDPNSKHPWHLELFTNDREYKPWLQLVKQCPYAHLVAEIPSRMGPYKIQQWLFAKKDPRPKATLIGQVESSPASSPVHSLPEQALGSPHPGL
jgi:hypothetical protein